MSRSPGKDKPPKKKRKKKEKEEKEEKIKNFISSGQLPQSNAQKLF
jgi:hypothetical protein